VASGNWRQTPPASTHGSAPSPLTVPAHWSELALEPASPAASVAPELLFDPAPLLDDPDPPLDDPEAAPELPLDAELPFEPEVPLDSEVLPELLLDPELLEMLDPELPPEPLSAAASPAPGRALLPQPPAQSAAYQAQKRTVARASIRFMGFPKRTPSRPTRRNRRKRPNPEASKTERGAVSAYSGLKPIFACVPSQEGLFALAAPAERGALGPEHGVSDRDEFRPLLAVHLIVSSSWNRTATRKAIEVWNEMGSAARGAKMRPGSATRSPFGRPHSASGEPAGGRRRAVCARRGSGSRLHTLGYAAGLP
jgi:hypothetical protein